MSKFRRIAALALVTCGLMAAPASAAPPPPSSCATGAAVYPSGVIAYYASCVVDRQWVSTVQQGVFFVTRAEAQAAIRAYRAFWE